VCSWSLQVKSVPELRALLDQLGVNVIQIACGDPHHASWNEGDDMPAAARAAGFDIHAAMIGFPGEDYTTPQTIKETGGFGNPATRAARLETLAAEWRGREFHGPRLDVFQSPLLNQRFAHLRRNLIAELAEGCLPDTINTDDYAELCHLISLQFVKRVINLVRTSGHGGSLVMLPAFMEGNEVATRWIDCKYSAEPDAASLRFRHLLQSIIRRVGQLCPKNSSLEQAWQQFRHSDDPELDLLEEAFFELARFFSDLMQVDGALVLDQRLCILGFGGEIRVDRNVFQVSQSHDLGGTTLTDWNVQADGTRHRSVYRLCSVEPKVIGFVISQDSQVRMIANVDESVVFWMHTVV
jgi:hypothetical protein